MKAYRIIVTGKVQGVFYRHTAQTEANRLGIVGIAKNQSDGSVLMEVEGNDSALKQFIDWAHVGSPGASVTGVEAKEIKPAGASSFEIK